MAFPDEGYWFSVICQLIKFYEGGIGLEEAKNCSYRELIKLDKNAVIIAKSIKKALGG